MTEDPDGAGDANGSGDDDEDAVPLNIAGHEDRAPPGTDEGSIPGGDTAVDAEASSSEGTDPSTNGASEGADPATNGASGESDPATNGTSDDAIPDVEHPEDADEDAVQPVELLVNLAEEGEIDPWDIDIMVVTDKFLDRLDDSDLRTSGRALFYASVLLRMKGDSLLQEDEEPEEDPFEDPWEQPAMEMEPDFDPVDQLEDEMERRLERKRVRGSPETLDELVHELRDAERRLWWKEARTYDTSESPEGFSRGTQTLDYRANDAGRMGDEPTEDDVTGTTHDEDIETVIEDVEAVLREKYDKGREEVLYAEVEQAGGSKVMTYLALLFLSHRGTVLLRQDDLFGDLWIRDPTAASGESGAVAD